MSTAVDAGLVVVVGYLVALTGAAWMAARRRDADQAPRPVPQRRFVVLVPAHNEEAMIGTTLDSLAAQHYPAALFAVHVVADNCSDETVAVTRGRGVEVHEHIAPDQGGKGPALEWLLRRLWERGDRHDAVVVVDADTTVSPGFLAAVDAAFSQAARVVQGYYSVREPELSTAASFRSAALAARHYLRPLGRTFVGGSAGLYGNGMAFAADVLRTHRWTNHLTEDIELQMELLLAGTRVRFAPAAVVEAEMPHTLDASRSQHERWERGRLDMARRYVPKLVRQAARGGPAGRVAYLDAALDLLVPPFSVLVAGTTVWTGVAVLRSFIAPRRATRRSLLIAALAVAGEMVYVLSALRLARAPASVYRALLGAPKFVVWKVRLWGRMVVRGHTVTWVRTSRNAHGAPHP
jgi:cellulose synthase/poly-beta-1,6-N-acetylglucosamine synthase-like glycosyltransferase